MTEIQEVFYRFCHHMSQRHIARTTGLSRNTVARLIKYGTSLGFQTTMTPKEIESIVDQVKDKYQNKALFSKPIQELLQKNHEQIALWWTMPHMTIRQVVRLLREKEVFVSEMSVSRYLKKHFPSYQSRITLHLTTKPGKQAQVDFGYMGMMKDATGRNRKAYAFIMTLSHSRHRFVRFVFKQDIHTWIDCHIRAFHFFGGVPETVLLDNLKSGIIKPDFYDPLQNRTYGECEKHYGFVIDPTKVRMPQHKGKVERSVTIVRQQILAGRSFNNIEEANQYALRWSLEEIGKRVVRTTGKSPLDVFEGEEKACLKPLPEEDYSLSTWQRCKVHLDHHVVFEGSFYSLPTAFIGQTIWIRGTEKLVEFFVCEKRIKVHPRSIAKGSWITDNNDYPSYKRTFLEKNETACLEEARQVGPSTYHFVEKIFKPTVSITTLRKVQAILRLGKVYGEKRLEASCQRSLSFEVLSYRGLKNILSKGLDAYQEEERLFSLSEGVYTRSLGEYSLHWVGE